MIHEDIVQAWDFLDPEMLLERKEVKAKLWEVVGDLAPKETTSPNADIRVSAGAWSGVIASVLRKWIYGVYPAPDVIQILMAYIVDLTAILEGALHLIQSRPWGAAYARAHPLSQDLIFLALEAYNESEVKKRAHTQIKTFVRTTQNISKCERVFERVSSLL
ncbi:hypothetical protein FRB93_011043 [Tulasnella sp. JGI-2019a]|nr:hypothetical protein FRB93_011043 [Tulasnella sp. JGI-2019a]